MSHPDKQGRLVVVSGPSGAGKTTVLRKVIQQCKLPLTFSVSATTRAPRPGERDGRDYHFLAADDFHRRRTAGDFLESFEVFGRGVWYGTLAGEVATGLNAGNWVVLDVDVQGAQAVEKQFPDAVTLFLDPGSLEELERRLRARGTESEEDIQRRLQQAREELNAAPRYQHRVINDTADRAAEEICHILTQLGD